MKEQFKTFLSQLSETNATLDYFTDFKKVIRNDLYEENPKVFEVLDILIAVRKDKGTKTQRHLIIMVK